MMEYLVNGISLNYEAIGEKHRGQPIVLLHNAIDLTANTSWRQEGFCVEKLFDNELYAQFRDNTEQLLRNLWKKATLNFPANEPLENYHQAIESKEQHLAAVELTKLISVDDFSIDIKLLEERISEICKESLIVKNPFDKQQVFHFRVIRPQQPDNNPLHRDVWLDDYDDCINLYIPVAGSTENSSLVIAPASHHWLESKLEITKSGALINGVKFNVPAVTIIFGDSEFVRPNPQLNEVLIFSPYLIHGGAKNLNEDATRISIEIRLWKK